MHSLPASLTDRPASLITGAAKRLGAEIAMHLASLGHDVCIHCHQSIDEARALSERIASSWAVRAVVLSADLSVEAQCEALVPQAIAALGRLDHVVNNASRFDFDTIDDVSHASLESHWRANTAPALILARALHRHLNEQGRKGCVVNLLDQKLWNPNPDYLSYTLSKSALEAATTLLAMALAPTLRVVGVAPGITLHSTDMDDATFSAAHQMTPLQRSSTPADVAAAVAYALSASALTGTSLLIDGGQHLMHHGRDVKFMVQT